MRVYKVIQNHSGSKSKIWKYFGFLVDDIGGTKVTLDEAICELCDERVKHSNNTTNLLMHLKCHHIIEYNKVISMLRSGEREPSEEQEQGLTNAKKAKQQNLVDMILKKEPYKKSSLRYQMCQDALVSFICNDLQLFSIVDSPAFLQLLYTLD